MDIVWIIIPLIFFAICLAYVGFLGRGGQDMENLIVGLVAVALIIYLFVVLLRPQKF